MTSTHTIPEMKEISPSIAPLSRSFGTVKMFAPAVMNHRNGNTIQNMNVRRSGTERPEETLHHLITAPSLPHRHSVGRRCNVSKIVLRGIPCPLHRYLGLHNPIFGGHPHFLITGRAL